MYKKMNLVLVFSAFLLTMCRAYEEPVSTIEGLSCRPYTDYFQGEGSRGLECFYTCPDGTVVGPFESQADPALSSTKGDLDLQLCGVARPTFTPREPPATLSPTVAPSVTPADSPTPEVTAVGVIPSTAEATLTAGISVTGGQSSVLTGKVLMCDLGMNLINFRLAQPDPNLTEKNLVVQIADMESTCYVNPTNPSLLTCTIPAGVSFPARVIATLGGAVVSDFTYTGIGCEILTTAVPTTTP